MFANMMNGAPSIWTCAQSSSCSPAFCQAEEEVADRSLCACLVQSGNFAGLTC